MMDGAEGKTRENTKDPMVTDKKATNSGKSDWKAVLKEWVITIIVAVTIAFAFRTTIASPRHIPTGSMIPTIKTGEFIFVSMFNYDWHIPFTRKSWVKRADPARGDIVVFEYPEDPSKDYIKRVIAIPGDTIEIRDKDIILNGKPLPKEVLEDRSILNGLESKYNLDDLTLFREEIDGKGHYVLQMSSRPGILLGPEAIPAESFFVMGDNRDDSSDSRVWGFVPREKLLGKGTFIWLSVDVHNFPFIRFGRLFTSLHREI